MTIGTEVAPLVVTAGEPAGIGPDLCIVLAASNERPPFVVIGDKAQLAERAGQLGIEISFETYEKGRPLTAGQLTVIDLPYPTAVECGKPDAANASTLLAGIDLAVNGCLRGEFSGLVTAPLAKHVIAASGIKFSGHTEYLAELTATSLPVMLLVAGDMRVALATTHLPLSEVPAAIDQALLTNVIEVLHRDLVNKFGIETPEIIVCGLNPHAGENGLLGHEDADVISPAIDECQRAGLKVRGPVPADTAFTPAAGHRDAVLAMYHDQGLPVLKYAGFGDAVNVTLGLPIIRTSVDHGTAFDLAGTGKAETGSMIAALRLAAQLAAARSP